MACPECQASIPGYFNLPGVISLRKTPVPAYCGECGSPFPWRRAALDELQLLFEESGSQELAQLAPDLLRETARTPRAIRKLQEWYTGNGSALHECANRMLEGIAVEMVKKSIGL